MKKGKHHSDSKLTEKKEVISPARKSDLVSGSLGLLNFTFLSDADSQEEADFHRLMLRKKKKKYRGFRI